MNIVTNSEANITLLTAEESISFILPPGTLYEKEFDDDSHPTIGAENKAIRISSDIEIQVLVYQSLDITPYYDAAYMVPNQLRANATYFTAAYDLSTTCAASGRFHQFYLVASFYDETYVSILQQDGTTFELELQVFGTFVQKTASDNRLGSGTIINSNNPINVISGNLCAFNGGLGTYASSISDVVSLGEEYIVPRIITEDSSPPGFSLSVVATEDGTTVESDGEMQTLDQGETAVFEYPYLERSVLVYCSRKCLVAQYGKVIQGHSGLIMQNILPEHEFSTSAYFTALDASPTSFLSLVAKGESTVDGLYLNGDSLSNLTWTPANGYSTAEVAISNGVYELESTDGRPFAAYIYFHQGYNGGGAGYTMLPTESSRVTTTPATTTTTTPTTTPSSTTTTALNPPINNTFPLHTARVNGTAFTEDGQEMTPACAVVSQGGFAEVPAV